MKVSLKREIEVVQTILRQLDECLTIYYRAKDFDKFKVCLEDYYKVSAEYKKLIAARNVEMGATKGEIKDVSNYRSRKAFSRRSPG
jgi:hypothetical protein